MKTIRILTLLTVFLFGGLLSCSEDFLDQQPIGSFGASILSDAEGIEQLLIGAYTPLNGAGFPPTSAPGGWILANMRGGEVYKGSTAGDLQQITECSQFNVTTGNNILGCWGFWYDAVYRCNQVLQILPDVEGISATRATQIEAEAKFLRAHYYFLLKRNFGNIPFIDETHYTEFRVPNTDESGNYVDAWPEIAADMDFARQNLPTTQPADGLGRPNKWAADAYYAKICIYRSNEGEAALYNEALTILTDVINNGITAGGDAYDLLPDYHDNFNASTENGPESVWAVQQSAKDGTPEGGFGTGPNGNQEGVYTGTQIFTGPGWGRGWGFNQPTPWYADHFRVDANGLPFLDMYTNIGTRLVDDYGLESTDPFTLDPSPVDPRIDWTMTRRGVPCLDYGIAPGKAWIRDQASGGPYITKKWYLYSDEDDIYVASGFFSLSNAINICVIRFSDVLLMAAEVEARVGSLTNARTYVNRVRNRMVQNSTSPDNWVKLADGVTDAANYQIGLYPTGGPNDPFQAQSTALDAILFERTLELGTEGHRFYDVVRFGKGDLILNAFLTAEEVRFDYLAGHSYDDDVDRYLPIPRDAIDRSLKDGEPTLTQNPGY